MRLVEGINYMSTRFHNHPHIFLYQQFELLKQHLSEEGMFASEYKHSIPQFARTVGIVTAPTGAAVRDIIQNAKRRNPYIQLILYPALVQGDGAVASIVTGIRTLDALGVDCMIIGRGGGSIEDLWAFNEEEVARAIFASNTPIISAVGHENDWTIADFVSDFRASTPTAAVEFAVFDYQQFESDLYQKQSFFQQRMSYIIASYRNETMEYTRNLKHLNPRTLLMNKRQQCIEFAEKLENSFGHQFDQKKHQLQLLTQQLDGLSPLKKLSSGYSYVSTVEGVHVTCASQVKLDDELSIYLSKGSIQAKVTEVIQ